MPIAFDPDKDAANIAKHGLSLAKAVDLEVEAFVTSGPDDYGSQRMRAYGLIDGRYHVWVFTVRNGTAWSISLRRTSRREYETHVRP